MFDKVPFSHCTHTHLDLDLAVYLAARIAEQINGKNCPWTSDHGGLSLGRAEGETSGVYRPLGTQAEYYTCETCVSV